MPLLRYRNCSLAIDWLARVLSFDCHVVVGSADGDILYAQMTLGSGMIMLGPLDASDLDSHLKQPEEVGGASTQTCYIVVDDIEAHYERAKSNGTEILLDLKSGPFGSRGYSCRDLDGHIWNFGSYDPWQGKRQPVRSAPHPDAKSERRPITREFVVFSLCLSALVVTLTTVRNELLPPLQRLLDRQWSQSDADEAAADARKSQATIENLSRSLLGAKSALTQANLDLERERSERVLAEELAGNGVEKIKSQVLREIEAERALREQSEKRASTAAKDFSQAREAKDAAERDAAKLKDQLQSETLAREAAESEAHRLREQLSPSEDQPKPANSDAVSTGATAPGKLDPEAIIKPLRPRVPTAAPHVPQRRERVTRRKKARSDASPPDAPSALSPSHPLNAEGPYMGIH